jgi:hypothetical protein
MKSRAFLLVGLLAAAGASSASPAAQAQAPVVNEPGRPTLARMLIINKDRTEAIPVTVQSGGDAIPVHAQLARQAWEYRQLSTANVDDASTALNGAGAEGWEVVAASTAPGRTVWTLKRPR